MNTKKGQEIEYQFFDLYYVGVTRFELATTRPPDAYSTELSYTPNRLSGCKSTEEM